MNTNGDRSRDLPWFAAGMDAASVDLRGGDRFWSDLERLTDGTLTEHLDDALAGAAAPRVWLMAHEQGQPQLGVVAALSFARVLAARDQAVVVLDGDDRTTVLSRWSGREDAEGWVDMVRYGTSVLTSGMALPFSGRAAYLVGVGSYAPTDITSEEVDALLARLRRQADDIIVVGPAPALGSWSAHVDRALLCVDRGTRTPAQIAELVAGLEGVGVTLTGLVGYGEPMPVPVAEEATPADGLPDGGADLPLAPAEKELPARPEIPEDPMFDGDDLPGDNFEMEFATRRGTSGVFWLAAATTVIIIAAVIFYYVRYVRVTDDGGLLAPPEVAATDAPSTPVNEPLEMATGSVVTDSVPVVTTDVTTDAATELPAEAPADATMDSLPVAPQETVVAAPEEVVVMPPADDLPTVDPYAGPVGQDGWVLWVYSFQDGLAAGREVAKLGRRDIQATVRLVELPDSGRWYRVYMGSFPNQKSARAAMPALFERLRTDWAQPVRF